MSFGNGSRSEHCTGVRLTARSPRLVNGGRPSSPSEAAASALMGGSVSVISGGFGEGASGKEPSRFPMKILPRQGSISSGTVTLETVSMISASPRRGPCWRWGGGPRCSPSCPARPATECGPRRRGATRRSENSLVRSGLVLARQALLDAVAVVGDVQVVALRRAPRRRRCRRRSSRASPWSRSWCGSRRRSSRP